MNHLENIMSISADNNGVLRTSEVVSKGISKTTLAKFIKKYNKDSFIKATKRSNTKSIKKSRY